MGLHGFALLGASMWPATWPWIVGAVAANHVVLTAVGLQPRSAMLGPNLVRLPPPAAERRQIALTFDDGPDPVVTQLVLDLLDRYGAKASFFCIGRRAAAHPALVREILRRGHDVENHSDNHPMTFACLPPSALTREIAAAQSRLADIVGIAPRFFRPPMGFRSPLLDPTLARLGLRHVSWSRRGYDAVRGDAARVFSRLIMKLTAGEILLLHDGQPSRGGIQPPIVLDVLPRLLERLSAAGFRGTSLTLGLAEAAAAR
jgi:peptidoglycan/xylan/chitin deacetylase (PgdA/CDA1 family)